MNRDDASIIAGIRGTAEERDAALAFFFRQHRSLRAQVIAYVAKSGGTEHDGEDVFQDAVVLFDRRIRKGAFKEESSLSTYFFSIAKFHWIGQHRRRKIMEELPDRRDEKGDVGPELDYIFEERKQIFYSALEQIGKKCKEVLGFYMLDYKMEEIAQITGRGSAAMAQKDAYKCRMKLRAYLLQRPQLLSALGVQLPDNPDLLTE
ncbi:MAG TPA: sigma-70 family RNA polymerase sigma factor [Saprospiraceae bacterium]|nr:sigma-70 family RNA polymerase sigma factor [Saprospiraceae bacterium]